MPEMRGVQVSRLELLLPWLSVICAGGIGWSLFTPWAWVWVVLYAATKALFKESTVLWAYRVIESEVAAKGEANG